MLIKEFLQLLRDPRMRIIVFAMPLVQMLVIAFALTSDVTNIKTAVLDLDKTPSSRELLAEFTSSGYFEIVEYIHSQSDINSILDESRALVMINIPSGFEGDLKAGHQADIQLLADGTDSNTTAIVFGYANAIIADFTQRKLEERLAAQTGGAFSTPRVDLQSRAWFNPNLESKYFYVPALISVMLIVISMVLTSVAVVREKEIGTIEQVMVTPITRVEFILGKTIPYAIIGYIVMTMMLILAMLIFGIRVEGSWILLYVMTGVYLVGNLGIALFISTTASTQQQALLTTFLIMLPTILLSGFLFPIRNMPVPVQYATLINPLRWYIEILRGVITKGVGIESLWPAILGQVILAILFTLLATISFRKTMA
jgi:ABC-2 type transport system permease protein